MGGNSLPKLNPDNPAVAEALSEVVAYWKGVDGWRLDAAHLLPALFLKKLRKSFENVNPQGILIGEEWEHAGAAIREGLYDGVTNFLFRRPLEAFFKGDLAAESLVRRLSLVPETYPWPGVVQSWNFLDNHDTDRFLTAVGGRTDRLDIAIALMFTLPGTPMIYYGDEIGMRGKDSLASRAPMLWERKRWKKEVFEIFKRFIALRKAHPVLATGSLEWLQASNESSSFAFARSNPEERIVVAVNAGEFEEKFILGGKKFSLPPGGVEVLFS
ncbi:MAG TPA: hypothetical protein DD435_14390 [Cyanobacteria bacterium UBA8530]|nr:hypothetical protein [Cyanobacteria bacterium UBA8530]